MRRDPIETLILALLAEFGPMATYRGLPLIHLAALFDRPDLVSWLIDQGLGVDMVDRRGRTPLFFAASRRMARHLMRSGADPEHRDLVDHTPLHAAARAGRVDVAHALRLAKHVDLHAQDRRGMTPLHAAASKGRLASIEHLLRQGANPNVMDRHGRHALFYAVAGGHIDAAFSLIDGGADLEILDDKGTSWLSLARMDQVGRLQARYQTALEHESDQEWMPSRPLFPRVAFHQYANGSNFSQSFSI